MAGIRFRTGNALAVSKAMEVPGAAAKEGRPWHCK